MFDFLNFRKVEAMRLDRAVERCYELEDDLKKLKEDNEKLHRIIENYKPDEITYKNTNHPREALDNMWRTPNVSVYKNGKEYEFKHLGFWNPAFEESDIKDSIIVTDFILDGNEEKRKKYVLNLRNCTYIQIK